MVADVQRVEANLGSDAGDVEHLRPPHVVGGPGGKDQAQAQAVGRNRWARAACRQLLALPLALLRRDHPLGRGARSAPRIERGDVEGRVRTAGDLPGQQLGDGRRVHDAVSAEAGQHP